MLGQAACVGPRAPPEAGGPVPAGGCAATVGRYGDAGQGGTGREQPLAEILGLDPATVAAVPAAERAVEVRHVERDRYVLAIAKITPPDAIDLWDVGARCVDGELRFETRSRYESADGEHVTRQQLRFGLIADADGSLVVRRQLRERALGLLDLRRGGDPLDYFRFAPHQPAGSAPR